MQKTSRVREEEEGGGGVSHGAALWLEGSSCVFSTGSREEKRTHLELPSAQLLAHLQSGVHRPLQVPLQAPAKVPEHGGASRQDNVLRWRDEELFSTSVLKESFFRTAIHLCQSTTMSRGQVKVVEDQLFSRPGGLTLYRGRLTSMGQFWMTSSTTSEMGWVKSGLANCRGGEGDSR